MFERFRYLMPTFAGLGLVFGFIFYVGLRMANEDTFRGRNGIMKLVTDGLNTFSETVGPTSAGYSIMFLAVFGGIYAAICVWRSPYF